MNQERNLHPHQASKRRPTVFEDLLGDSIERAFASGVTTMETMVEQLNLMGPLNENSEPWTVASYQATMARLGA